METVIIIVGAIQVITLIVFFVMAANVSQIKKYIKLIVLGESTFPHIENSEISEEHSGHIPDGLLVVELKTGKQMRIGDRLENGKYKCYRSGFLVDSFDESEFMEFNKWVNEVYKKWY